VTFKEIQDAVLTRRFKESQRADAKSWINHRYWWIWTLEDWNFTEGEALVSTTASSMTLSNLPTDIRTVRALLRQDGEPLKYLPWDEFYRTYYGTSTPATSPLHWTRVAGTYYVGPAADITSAAYKLIYRKEYTKLVADGDVPLLPEGAHLALVHGGGAEGRKLESDPMYLAFDQDFNATVDILRENYLVDQRGDNRQWPAYNYLGG
jgi:hypothetical protein